MAESIKKRLAATSNRSNDLELRKLLNAALTDLAALRSTMNNCVTDIATIKSKYNNALNLLDVDANVAATNYFSVNNVGTLASSAPAALTLTS